jgi:hypothetical protein
LNQRADKGEYFAIQGIVNRGSAGKMPLGWAERKACYERALKVLPNDFHLAPNDLYQSQDLPEPDEATEKHILVSPNRDDDLPSEPDTFATNEVEPNLPSIEPQGYVTTSQAIMSPTHVVGTLSSTASDIPIVEGGGSDDSARQVGKESVSFQSLFQIYYKQFLGVGGLIYGFLEANWIYLVVGLVLLILAAYLYTQAKKRADARQSQQLNIASRPELINAEIASKDNYVSFLNK